MAQQQQHLSAMMNSMGLNGAEANGSSSGGYLEKLEGFRRSDAARDEMVTELVNKLSHLEARYNEKCDDYNNEVESRRMWQAKASANERAVTSLKQASGASSFALVIIDGDGAIFQDYLLRQGREGGAEAAHQLYTHIKDHLLSIYPDANVADWSIVVHIFLNLEGLAKKLHASGLIANPNELAAFGRQFGLSQPMFNFFDVGSGKERADYKVRSTLALYLRNTQCKHIFFGPCADNGYLPALEPYKKDSTVTSRLTLIETTPAEPGFISLGFNRIHMPGVFRSDQLPNARPPVSYGISSPQQSLANPVTNRTNSGLQSSATAFVPTSTKSPSPAPSVDSGNGNSSWATIGKGTVGKNINITPKKQADRPHVILNAYDERLDKKLPGSDPAAEKRFADRIKTSGKLCNSYHLSGKCPRMEYCDYKHGERLSPGEQLVLRHKARTLSCPEKYQCRDVNCPNGHICKMGSDCYMSDEQCWFGDTHGMDREPARKMYEDGTEEWLQSYLEKAR
ncbi:hypothetical protein MBLNU230_g0288t1 [Neophaeotheca triangularis]